MTLNRYIDKHGFEYVSELLGVKQRTLKSWYYGERSPRPKTAQEIEKLTNKKVKFRECY